MTETDVYDLRSAAQVTTDDRKATMEEIRLKCETQITETFSKNLQQVLDGYAGLALNAEDEAVREKASRKIIDTFKRPTLPQPSGTNIVIQNALVPEMAMMNGRPMTTIEAGPVKIATPLIREDRRALRQIGPEPVEKTHKAQYAAKSPVTEDQVK